MDIKILCTSCKANYLCLRTNTKMYGPIVETICPRCKQKVIRNMGAFLETQTVLIDEQIIQASTMITLSRAMEKLIGNEEAYKKKKK